MWPWPSDPQTSGDRSAEQMPIEVGIKLCRRYVSTKINHGSHRRRVLAIKPCNFLQDQVRICTYATWSNSVSKHYSITIDRHDKDRSSWCCRSDWDPSESTLQSCKQSAHSQVPQTLTARIEQSLYRNLPLRYCPYARHCHRSQSHRHQSDCLWLFTFQRWFGQSTQRSRHCRCHCWDC